ncbi:BTAD domain-containing putative transcriptional regulator [Nocardia neocaledoniensis]|uniref:BTAD domain-containing putative transcriptional regulator n=1 Tax=Nocardia neocaledoniensis TaxID=236511 RepID=UPI0024569C7C|nr:BTAD domain-containing putative transcriptional regulator [Nocardia neocaledoniensis]
MRFGVLGPLTVWTDGGAVVPIPGTKVRALLADLLLAAGQPVSADRLVDDIWGEDPPGNPAGTLAAKASQLRRALDDAEPGSRDLVVSPPPGYRLASTEVDALRFRALLAEARTGTDPGARIATLTEALGLWRGPAFDDFRDAEFTRSGIAQLDELRLVAVEELAEARLSLGEYGTAAGELAPFVAAHPLRERLRAAQLRALYGAGRQADALDSYEDLRRQLADELGLDPSPELVDLHRSILGQDPGLVIARPAAVVRRRTTNIRAERTELIGRAADLAALTAAVGQSRLVSLIGPGGVGKTRLATATAAGLTFPHGTWLVELAPLAPETTDAHRVADAVARAVGVRPGEGADPVEALEDALSEQELLLVVDNCEHIIEHVADLVAALLGAAPGLRVLATSREQLRLAGEHVVAIEPLTLPAPGSDPAVVAESDAVRLFVTRARAGAREFTLDAGNADAVATLCRRLDGIPLALELAATRVRALGVHEMVARLDDRFRLLATGHRGAPPRQQTLAAMIDWSWGLLDGDERLVLRRLAVHAGGCTLAAAESVCAAGSSDTVSIEPALVADVIARLVDRSLVCQAGRRYHLLESVAAFSTDRLAEAGEEASVRRAQYAYYLALAERAAPELYGADQRRWLAALDAEDANLQAALDGYLALGDAEGALRLADALAWYWLLRGRLQPARRRFAAALALGGTARRRAPVAAWELAAAFRQGDFADVTARRTEVTAGLAAVDDPVERVRAEVVLLVSALEAGANQDLEASVRALLADAEQFGDRWTIATIQVALAKSAHSRADVDALARHATEAARLFAELGDRWGRLQAAEWLGGLAELTGDLSRAAEIHREALVLAKELELWGQVSAHLCWLGWIAMQHTAFDDARDMAEQAMVLAAEQGDGAGRLFASIVLAFTARRDGRPEEAEGLLRTLLADSADDAETPLFVPMLQVELGYLLELRGEPAAGLAEHLRAFDGSQRIDAPRDAAFALGGAAAATAALGEFDTAARLLGAAEALRADTGMPLLPAERPDIDRATDRVRAELGADSFTAAHAAGLGLTAVEARRLIDAAAVSSTL